MSDVIYSRVRGNEQKTSFFNLFTPFKSDRHLLYPKLFKECSMNQKAKYNDARREHFLYRNKGPGKMIYTLFIFWWRCILKVCSYQEWEWCRFVILLKPRFLIQKLHMNSLWKTGLFGQGKHSRPYSWKSDPTEPLVFDIWNDLSL